VTAPFVTELRTTDDVVRVGGGNGAVLHLRVQSADLWNTLRVDASGSTTVREVKNAALDHFFPLGYDSNEIVAKLRGFEILDEERTLESAGVKDGSTLLLAKRRRRPVR
jgi:hypothetical protein